MAMALRMQTRENNKQDALLERIHQLECKEAIILKESHELREQNELLEFRIIELEEGADKVSIVDNTNTKYVSIHFNFIFVRCNLNVGLSTSRQVNLLLVRVHELYTAVIGFGPSPR